MNEIMNAINFLIRMASNTPVPNLKPVPTPTASPQPEQIGWQNQGGKIVPLYGSPSPATQQQILPIATPTNYLANYTRSQVPQNLRQLIIDSGNKYGVDPSLLSAMIFQESGMNTNTRDNINYDQYGRAISRDRGPAQINDIAHPEVSDQQAYDPNFAIPWMAKQLANTYKQKGSWSQAIASYNVGSGMTGQDSSRDQYGLGPKGRNYVTGIRSNLNPSFANSLGLPSY